MIQPTRNEITKKIQDYLENRIDRETVGEWALKYIHNDDAVDINDMEAWHYLVEISKIDVLLMPNEYLYSDEDLRDMIKKYQLREKG